MLVKAHFSCNSTGYYCFYWFGKCMAIYQQKYFYASPAMSLSELLSVIEMLQNFHSLIIIAMLENVYSVDLASEMGQIAKCPDFSKNGLWGIDYLSCPLSQQDWVKVKQAMSRVVWM